MRTIRILFFVFLLAFLKLPIVSAQSWALQIPSTFPKFFSSNPANDLLLNDMFYRHYSMMLGPDLLTGPPATFYMEWDALITLWIDTAHNQIMSNSYQIPNATCASPGAPMPCRPVDYNWWYKDFINHAIRLENGYVWSHALGARGHGIPQPVCIGPNDPTGCNDTRLPVNNAHFILGIYRYFTWKRDADLLKQQMGNVRTAIHFLQTELGGDQWGLIQNPWIQHEGRNGSLMSNWWDILPFGWRDPYLTNYYYAALLAMAELEKLAETNPQWNISPNPYGENSTMFLQKAASVKRISSDYFWWDPTWSGTGPKNYRKGRFFGVVDKDGNWHDFGFTFLNLEAIYYGLTNTDQETAIIDWLDGAASNTFPEDTAKTKDDIYYFRLAPRATTKDNHVWYVTKNWNWNINDPHTLWGHQVQNGGTTFSLSFYDILARLKVKGPDDAYSRFNEVLQWYADAQNGGGYEPYLRAQNIELQGCGGSGGRYYTGAVGIDCEFTESSLVPTAFLYGFLGVSAQTDGLHIKPQLPMSLTFAGVDKLFYIDNYLKITVRKTGTPSIHAIDANHYEVTAIQNQEIVISPQMELIGSPTPTPTRMPSSTPTPPPLAGDINGDCAVNVLDYGILFEQFGKNPLTDPRADLNHDGVVNILDYGLLFENFGRSCS